MSSSPFASLNAGMLVRKGAAAPSLETGYRPAAAIQAFATPAAPPKAPEPPRPAAPAAAPPPRPRLVEAVAAQAACAAPPSVQPGAKPPAIEFPNRAGVRLNREQARALKLAALLLDRPQQELLSDGLDLRLAAVACGPLADCACFRAAVEKIAKP